MEKCVEEKITPEKALELLRKEGIDVSIEHAKAILELLRLFAVIVVEKYMQEPDGIRRFQKPNQ